MRKQSAIYVYVQETYVLVYTCVRCSGVCKDQLDIAVALSG